MLAGELGKSSSDSQGAGLARGVAEHIEAVDDRESGFGCGV
jgi:hypothetical protein